MTVHRKLLLCFCLYICVVVNADLSGQETAGKILFNQDIRPILSNHCFACHGHDEEHRESGVRLDIADEADLDDVVERIVSDDPDSIMPPPRHHKPLSPEQIKTLKAWVAQGGEYQDHWSFVSPTKPAVPDSVDSWSNHAIDRFVQATWTKNEISPVADADKRTLIRRASLDLTGLPPTPDAIKAFLDDDSEGAFSKVVDRLIASPQYGEHMARYWLDLVRFADTNGMHHDHFRDMTQYRDWVIRSFNNNLAFDDFVTYQLAGDLYDEPSNDQLIASGFNRLHLIIDVGTALPEESFYKNVVDRVTSVGTAFMGLTVQCAACHDHKYDPITQKEFYQLYAFFNNFDGQPETGGRSGTDFKRGLQKPYLNLPSPAQKLELVRLQAVVANLDSKIAVRREEFQAELKAAEAKAKEEEEAKKETEQASGEKDEKTKAGGNEKKTKKPDQPEDLKILIADRKAAQKQVDDLMLTIPAALIMKERTDVRPAHIYNRGVYDQPGELVTRDTPSFLPPMPDTGKTKTRMDLAKWMTTPENPLTARVTVNRIWQQFFGYGLVVTSEDFGAQGTVPSHPELLDHLATKFVESNWDVKALVRSIVLSRTYHLTSRATQDQYVADPTNRWLARGSRFRLDAEVIRDQVLSVSGLLNSEMHGPSVKPPQPAGLWKLVAMPSSYPNEFSPDSGSNIYRRSVYTFWKRGLPPPQMTIFDAPSREACIARRERTNTPLQALLMMNEEQYFSAAMHLANQLTQKTKLNDAEKIAIAYETITSHSTNEKQAARLLMALAEFRKLYTGDSDSATAMLGISSDDAIKLMVESGSVDDHIELASWTMLVHSLLNLDATKTRE